MIEKIRDVIFISHCSVRNKKILQNISKNIIIIMMSLPIDLTMNLFSQPAEKWPRAHSGIIAHRSQSITMIRIC